MAVGFTPGRPLRRSPIPLLRRLTSTSPYRARAWQHTYEPRPAGLWAAPAGRTRCPGCAGGAARGAADEGRWWRSRGGGVTRPCVFP